MTDNNIIKALECCANNGDCEECAINPHHGNYGYCTSLAIKAALDLINRQKAEIDELREINDCRTRDMPLFYATAIREFAERLKASFPYSWLVCSGVRTHIDNLVKEMTEGKT